MAFLAHSGNWTGVLWRAPQAQQNKKSQRSSRPKLRQPLLNSNRGLPARKERVVPRGRLALRVPKASRALKGQQANEGQSARKDPQALLSYLPGTKQDLEPWRTDWQV